MLAALIAILIFFCGGTIGAIVGLSVAWAILTQQEDEDLPFEDWGI